MGFFLRHIVPAKKLLQQTFSTTNRADVPKCHLAVYIGESEKNRFVIPLSFLNHTSFQDLLIQAGEEFGFEHLMGGLTIPCREDDFAHLISNLNALMGTNVRENINQMKAHIP